MRIETNTVKLDALTPKVKRNIVNALNRASLRQVAAAQIKAPVDTGYLRSSIQQEKQATVADMEAVNAVGAEYGIYQELGTIRQAAQPYMLPAFVETMQAAKDDLAKVIE